ncbi:MAG: hypothetical protein GY863_01960 [bacterium]|nr:hypothetical protein [bacterium]
MIDINLLGKKKSGGMPKIGVPNIQKPNPKLTASLAVVVVVFAVYWFFGDTILSIINPPAQYEPITFTPPTDTVRTAEQTTVDTAQTVVDEQPEEPEASRVTWDYKKSMLHIQSYIELTSLIPENAEYNVISVSGDRIITEIEKSSIPDVNAFQSQIRQSLSFYDFTFTEGDGKQYTWGTLKSDHQFSPENPSGDYVSPESVLSAINDLAARNRIRIRARNISPEFQRNSSTIIPGWIKFSGGEDDILEFLSQFHDMGLSINITKISGTSVGRSGNSNASVHLNFQYELIL